MERTHGCSRAGLGAGLTTFIRHRHLLWQFTARNISIRHRGSHLGVFWTVLNPLLLLGLYTFVFGIIFGGKFGVLENESSLDYALGLFLGLSMYNLISEILNGSTQTILGNPNFVKKVVFPLEILPVAAVGASLYHFLITLLLCFLGILLFGNGVGPGIFWLPLILLPLILIALGLAWFLAALGVFFRDTAQVMQFLSQALLYASAIFYPMSKIPDSMAWFLNANPLIHAIELARRSLLWHTPIDFASLAFLLASAIFGSWFGYVVFMRLKPGFADVV